VILRGLNKGQKKEIYFCNKAKIFSSFLLMHDDACTLSYKIVVASKRPLICINVSFFSKVDQKKNGETH